MSKHTPGPWIGAGPSFGDPLPRYTTEIVTEWEDEGGEVLAICELPLHHHDNENEANARLIAAAPELLEALRMFVVWYGRRDKHDTLLPPKMQEAELAQAMRAIAKAEGAPE